jgi:TrpR-related protein YerC/YecD
MNIKNKKISNEAIERLYQAIVSIKDIEECEAILEDLCTITEIQAMAQRLDVAKMLRDGCPYTDIVDETRASSTTVSRVSRCLNYGNGGYHMVLDRIEGKE